MSSGFWTYFGSIVGKGDGVAVAIGPFVGSGIGLFVGVGVMIIGFVGVGVAGFIVIVGVGVFVGVGVDVRVGVMFEGVTLDEGFTEGVKGIDGVVVIVWSGPEKVMDQYDCPEELFEASEIPICVKFLLSIRPECAEECFHAASMTVGFVLPLSIISAMTEGNGRPQLLRRAAVSLPKLST